MCLRVWCVHFMRVMTLGSWPWLQIHLVLPPLSWERTTATSFVWIRKISTGYSGWAHMWWKHVHTYHKYSYYLMKPNCDVCLPLLTQEVYCILNDKYYYSVCFSVFLGCGSQHGAFERAWAGCAGVRKEPSSLHTRKHQVCVCACFYIATKTTHTHT